ncbi:MAG: SpoIIE family protein phosphatase, partial [Crocinitomicaceae bacterium]|nr:SpoIIE family protein phosphatase [Crocinitomicaceae bacterium]
MGLALRIIKITLIFCVLGHVYGQAKFTDVPVNIVGAKGIYDFNHYSSEEGLLGSVAENVFQDSKGYVWVATRTGVNRLDGRQVKTFSVKDGLVHYLCRSITEDKLGRIWVATEAGVSCYDGFGFKNYTTNEGLSFNQTWAVLEHRDGGMLVGTSHGLDIIRDGTVQNYVNFDTTQGKNAIRMLEYDSKGNLWVSTGIKLFKVSPDKEIQDMGLDGLMLDMDEAPNGDIWISGWSKNLVKYSNGEFTSYIFGTPVNSVKMDREGNLWLASWSKGLLKFDGKNRAIQFGTDQGIALNTLWSVLVDAEGTICCASYGAGVDQLANERFSRYTETNGLANNVVNEIAIDKKNHRIWVATEGGLSKIDSQGVVTSFTEKDGLDNGKVQTVVIDSNGVAWIALYGGSIGMYKVGENSSLEGIGNGGFNMMIDTRGYLWIGRDGGGAYCYKDINIDDKGRQYVADGFNSSKIRVHKIFEDSDHNIWFGIDLNAWHILDHQDSSMHAHLFPKHMEMESGVFIEEDNRHFVWFTLGSTGIYRGSYNKGQMSILDSIRFEQGLLSDEVAGLMAEGDRLWINTIAGLTILDLKSYYENGEYNFTSYTKEKGFSGEGFANIVRYSEDEVLVGTTKGMLVFHESKDRKVDIQPFTNIVNVKLDLKEIDWRQKTDELKSSCNVPVSVVLPYNENHLTFEYVGISFTAPEEIRYSYILEGFDLDWSPITGQQEITYSNIPPGEYYFKVKSVNLDGVWDDTPDAIKITITPPFWQTWWFRTLTVFALALIIFGFFQYRTKKLRAANELLEQKVEKRTEQLQIAYDQIEEKNHEITDSISYAKRIQEAILPPASYIKEQLGESFVLYKPKDIVAGDFYWLNTIGNKVLFAAADCTGHGVPGAMVSVVCHGALNRSVREFELHEPNTILDKTREIVIETFSKSETDVKDGMDVSVCSLDRGNNILEYSGANNSLYYIKDGVIEEIRADKQPVGKYDFATPFTKHEIKLEKGMCVYLFSDGFADQFGGDKGKKLKYKPFKEIILRIHHLPMDEQKLILDKEFLNWKGDFE